MSTSDSTNPYVTVRKQLAGFFTNGQSANAEGTLQFIRGLSYSEMAVQNLMGVRTPALADEGSYWTTGNVPGTAILDTAASNAFAAVSPTMVIYNSNPAGGATIYPVRFKVEVAAAGTSGTNWVNQWLVDTGNRWASGGTLLVNASPNMGVANSKSGAVVHFGALVAPAANASRILSSTTMRTVLKVIGDEYTWEFGNSSAAPGTGMPSEGTLQLQRLVQLPAVGIAPGNSMLWYEYGASQATAAQFDNIQLDYIER